MEKPVFSTKIRYLPPPRNGRELIIRKSTFKYQGAASEQAGKRAENIVIVQGNDILGSVFTHRYA